MTLKTFVLAAAVTAGSALPALAACDWSKQAMTCADGMVYDSDSRSCIAVNT